MKKSIRFSIYFLICLIILASCAMAVCNYIVVHNAEGRIYENVDSIPSTSLGLLLGTTPQTRIGGRQNYFFKYRIEAAEALYKAGKIEYILISGDENSLDGINEPQCMMDSLVARGIPKEAIYLDGKGFRTLDSVVRLNKIYKVRTFTIISQRFHNERALYLAEHLGLDVEGLQAFNAKSPTSAMSLMTYIREYFARVKMFLDIAFGEQPKVMGEEQPLGDQILYDRMNSEDFWRDINSVRAHDEQDTIVGNFTGHGIDTLYVEVVDTKNEEGMRFRFFMASNNKKIPKVELYGCDSAFPKLVNEGDLDGNGTCEVGYLHTWVNSQWRYYRIFSLVGKEWRYLLSGDYLDTSEGFRHMGVEVAEPGPKKGTVRIHYLYDGYDEIKEERLIEIRDTIVSPTFDVIDDLPE